MDLVYGEDCEPIMGAEFEFDGGWGAGGMGLFCGGGGGGGGVDDGLVVRGEIRRDGMR